MNNVGVCASLALILFVSAIGANAQTVGGSVYSYFGVGNMQGRSSAYNRALGYTGIAVRSDYNINGINPASYNSIARPFTTLFELGAYYETVGHQTNTSSSTTKAGNLNGLNILIKASQKLAVVVGASPFSSISYKASSPRQFGILPPITVVYEGTGGINQFYAGMGYEVFKNFSVGGNLTYYLGTVKKTESIPSTGVTDPLEISNKTTAHNLGLDFGFQYGIKIKESKLTVGGTWDPGASLSGVHEISVVNLSLDTLKKTDVTNTQFELPQHYGGGLGYRTGRSTIAADVNWYNWEKAVLNDGQVYRNSFKYSVGYEYHGNLSSTKYLSAIAIRAGAFVQDYPLVIKNTPFQAWGYNFGISLPLDGYRASVNLNYNFVQMGTTVAGMVKERSDRIVIDFIVRDIWGIKRKVD